MYVYRGWLKIGKTALRQKDKGTVLFPQIQKVENGHRRPPHVVSSRFCIGRSLCYVLLSFLIKFVKQRAREELVEGHIKPITKLFNGSTSKVRSV